METKADWLRSEIEKLEGMEQMWQGPCPECRGNGYTVDYDPSDQTGNTAMQVQCHVCEASGVIEMPNVEYNEALTSIITRYKEELKVLTGE